MPRRLVSSELFRNEEVSELDFAGRLFFIGCITYADDDGRLKGSEKWLKAQIFPYDSNISEEFIKQYKKECHDKGIIHCYHVNGSEYISLPKWGKWQSIRADRRKESEFPPPDNHLTTNSQPQDNQVGDKCLHNINKDNISKDNIIGEIFNTFNDNFQKITEKTKDIIDDFINEYGEEKVKYALDEAILYNKRTLKYVEGILKGNGDKKKSGITGNNPTGAFSNLDKEVD